MPDLAGPRLACLDLAFRLGVNRPQSLIHKPPNGFRAGRKVRLLTSPFVNAREPFGRREHLETLHLRRTHAAYVTPVDTGCNTEDT